MNEARLGSMVVKEQQDCLCVHVYFPVCLRKVRVGSNLEGKKAFRLWLFFFTSSSSDLVFWSSSSVARMGRPLKRRGRRGEGGHGEARHVGGDVRRGGAATAVLGNVQWPYDVERI